MPCSPSSTAAGRAPSCGASPRVPCAPANCAAASPASPSACLSDTCRTSSATASFSATDASRQSAPGSLLHLALRPNPATRPRSHLRLGPPPPASPFIAPESPQCVVILRDVQNLCRCLWAATHFQAGLFCCQAPSAGGKPVPQPSPQTTSPNSKSIQLSFVPFGILDAR